MEPPSVPVSHYKSGVTRSAQDNGPARPIKRRGLLPRVKGKKPSTSHSLTLWLGKAERAEAASRFPRLIHPPSHKVSIVYSSTEKHPNHTIRLQGEKRMLRFLPFTPNLLLQHISKNKKRWNTWLTGLKVKSMNFISSTMRDLRCLMLFGRYLLNLEMTFEYIFAQTHIYVLLYFILFLLWLLFFLLFQKFVMFFSPSVSECSYTPEIDCTELWVLF